jgi:hypothetical protein
MSRFNHKFGRVNHTATSMLRAGGHLSGSASPMDPEQPAPQMPMKMHQLAQASREHPVVTSRGIQLPTPRLTLEGPA